MWLPILALIIGYCAVVMSKMHISAMYTEYIGVAVVAGFDSVVGAIRSFIEGRFNDRVFVSGFFSNAALAALLLYLGNQLNINYVAVAIMVALFIRIFNNLGFVRRYYVARIFEKQMGGEKVFPEP